MQRDRVSDDEHEPEASALRDLASQLAKSHVVSRRPMPKPSLLDHVRKWESLLREASEYFGQMPDAQRALSYTAEWLLDNFHIVQRALRQVREAMPVHYYRQLPKLGVSPLAGYPRVYALARAVVEYCQCHLDLEQVKHFVQAYQRVTLLTTGELWAVPTMLRLAILERLARAVGRVIGGHEWDDGKPPALAPLSTDLTDDAIVAGCVHSLRMLETQDWKTFFEDVSQVEQVLRRDPADVYARMDFDTRDHYRGVIEELALTTGQDDKDVAWEAIRLAKTGRGSPRTNHVGFYLLDEGRAQLEACLDYHPPFDTYLRRWLCGHPLLVYLGGGTLLTLTIVLALICYASIAGGTLAQLIAVGLLTLLPATAAAVSLVNWLISRIVPPRALPKMDFSEGIPAECSTMVVVPALVSDADEVESLLRRLEIHFLGNEDPHLSLALLTDFADTPQKHVPDDDALLEQVKDGIQALNEKHGRGTAGPFYLFHRERKWNPCEDCWMGWERKRGKLIEFNRLLGGSGETSYVVQTGDLDVLQEIRYVITLDADTTLPRDGARRLIATLAHPLNVAEWDPGSDAVVAGYTVLQPRMQIKPAATNRSLFAQVFAGDTVLDLYTRAVSDVYQDLFGEGSYVGKGIYNVVAFERSLSGRVPENALASHDLFEGVHGRSGLLTDVSLFEDYPSHYLAYARRLHRWVRGDWQLLPWLLPRVPHAGEGTIPNDLSMLDRWKIVDNLRRSLLAPALLALLVAGWLWLPGSALAWTLAGVLAPAMPFVISVVARLIQTSQPKLLGSAAPPPVWADVLRWLLALVFLPYEALLMLDAIGRTLVRLTITHKRMLQWTTFAHTVRFFGKASNLALTWKNMCGGSFLALGLALLVGLINLAALPVAAPLLLAWLASPQIAYWIGRPAVREPVSLSADQRRQLRRLARRTWLYFERFVGPEDRWLPPDHFQENPRGLAAHRTSPTNIGLLLLSTLAAYDLGYVGLMDLAVRLRSTFQTLDDMERYRGHFLNWYETLDLEPLPPRYVSTVDSGNLAGCLLALKQGCLGVPDAPLLRWQRLQGLLDTVDILTQIVDSIEEPETETVVTALRDYLIHIRQRVLDVQHSPESWGTLLLWLDEDCWEELNRLLMSLLTSGAIALDTATLRSLRVWSRQVRYQLHSLRPELDLLLPWLAPLSRPPSLFDRLDVSPAITNARQALVNALPLASSLSDVPDACEAGRAALERLQTLLADEISLVEQANPEFTERVEEARAWCEQLAEGLDSAQMSAEGLAIGYRELSEDAGTYLQEMDFGFLFNARRQVFHIGYNADTETLDANYYDLMASEARIASLLAIAKGDVPQSHWLHLGRPITQVSGARALLSWGGTMFEYLMPPLLVRHYEGTLLEQSCLAAVDYQIAYARRKGVPWGISESGYYRFDAAMNYQYRGFGVPGLGFRRGLSEDLVIAPYASLLALPLRPQAVMRNVERLIELQMLGDYGFYEAMDYTESRVPSGQDKVIVRSYMVHHHGMSLLAMTNYLQDDVMVQRFHADPQVQSVQLLLQEQVPSLAPVEFPHPDEVRPVRKEEAPVAISPWRVPVDSPMPQAHVLSNGRYSVLITSAGGGYSSCTLNLSGKRHKVALTRWRADTTLDDWGTWFYVQDRDSGDLWSAGLQPVGSSPESQEVLFYAHKAEFRRRDHDISLRMEVTVPPHDDVEVRRITLTNHGDRPRRLRVTSYGEVVLAPQAADRRHPAFSKLFVESEWLPRMNGLLFRRRPRSAEEVAIYAAHLLVMERGQEITGAYESDRSRFLGRGGSLRSPAAMTSTLNQTLSGTTGATLDPIMALGQDIELKPHATAELAYVTLAAGSRQEAMDLAGRYREWATVDRAFDQARSRSGLELRRLELKTPEMECIQQLLSLILYPHAALRADPATLAANSKGQPALWAYGISGDYPIILVRIASEGETDLLRELLQAHAYWRNRQLEIDLVILNERSTGYDQELQNQLFRLIARMNSDAWLNRRGGIFVLRADQMDEADRVLLETSARAVLDGEKGSLAEQLEGLHELPVRLPGFVSTTPPGEGEEGAGIAPPERPDDLLFDNGLGGFSADGREYVIYLEPGQWTPAPWVNVIANAHFGFIVSEAGSGYTWAENSGENRLTPWRNDPVADPPGEALYLRDEETGEVWSPTPLPAGAPASYLIRHGAGYSIFEHNSHGLKQRVRVFAAPDAPVKIVHLQLKNAWDRNRRITATFYAEWVLGLDRDVQQQYVLSEFDAVHNVLLAHNPYNEEFGERLAFLSASKEPHGITADRTEFLGREGSFRQPVALGRVGLDGTVKAGLDPCAAYQVHVWLAPGETKEVFFLLGQGADREQTLRLVERYQDAAQVEAAWEEVTGFWDDLLSTVTVRTPDPAMDMLLNRWLLYQALVCRVWGRSALYQSSGAFGYRDQLQDVTALTLAAPDLVRDHILEAAAHQFRAGDVLHWWHPPSGRGVRTRCSDDLVWLPFVTAHYVTATGDETVLTEKVPFLRGDPLEPEEHDRYGHWESTTKGYTVYEHCRRALDRGLTAGAHGLPLIGSHDWNDGYSRVGIEGKGESVWLGWFLYATLTQFASICEMMDEDDQAAVYRQQAGDILRAVEEQAWDGEWYRRAYYDDGTPMGSVESGECQIDSLAQSWAVLSGAADPARAAQAMESAADRLVRSDDKLILLFTPPFDETEHDPGYIKGYLPGIRENGGQYTHAALWLVWAFAQLGQGDRAEALFRLLNPIYHSDSSKKVALYRVEPYVVAADVYGAEPHVGRGGWTWYTGSAGWMYRLGLEAILGLRKRGDALRIDPCIPGHWPGFELIYRNGKTSYRIRVEKPKGINRGVKQVTLDGERLPAGDIPLLDDGRRHEVCVVMG